MGNDYLSSLGQDFLKKLQLDKAKEAAKEKINNDGNLDFNETQELAGSVFSIGEDGTVSVEDSTINNLLSDLGVDKQSTDYDQLVEETRDELMTNVQDIVSQNEEQITTEEGLTEYDLIIENYGEYLKSIGVDIDDYSANDEDWSAISQIIADANPDLNVAWGEEIPAGTQINLPKIKIDENGKLVQAPDEETSSVDEETKNEYLERIEDLMADKDGIKGTDDDLDMIPDDISVEIDGQTYDKTAIQELFDPANLKNSDISGETIEKIYNVLASGDLDGPDNGADSMGALKDAISSVVSEYNGDSQNYDGEGIEGFENTTGLIDNGDGTYSVEVQEWGSDALDGNEYANDALSRIIANYYPDVEMYSEEYDKVLEEIMSRNEQITDPNLIHTGDKIELPVPEYDENGAITGFKTLEEVQGTTESQEAEETDETVQGTTESQDAEETDEITGEITTDGTEEDATNQGSVENADGEAQISDEVKEDLEALGLDPDKVEVVQEGDTIYYNQYINDNSNTYISISYDSNGNITKESYEDGNLKITEKYDENNKLTEKTENQEDGSSVTNIYDENGKVIESSNSQDTTSTTSGISDEVKEDLEVLGLDPDKVEVVGDENITYYVQGNISITYDLGDFISKNYNDESGNTFATENYDSETNELTGRTILYNDGSFIVENYDENGNVTSKSYWMDNEQISSESFIYNEDGSVTHTITDANGEVTTEELSAEDVPPATEIPESFGPPPADAAATATATGTEIADEITSILADTKEGLEMLSGDNANKKLESSLQSIEDALSAINDMEDEDAKAEVLQNVISQLGKSGLTQITDIMDTVTKDHWIRRDERAGDDHKEIIEMLTTVDFNYPDNIKMLKEFYADRADNFWGKESFEENLYTIDENDIDTLGQMPVDTKRDLLESLFNDDLFSYHAGFDNEQKQLFKAIIMPNADYPQSFIDSKALIDEYRKSHNDTENMYMLSFHIADHQDILNNLSVEQMAEIIQLAGGGDTEEAIAKGKEWMEQYILDIYQYDGGEEMARESVAMFTLTEC